DPTIQNVYVSTNPDFIDRINAYVRDVQKGRPVAGFVEEFNVMVHSRMPGNEILYSPSFVWCERRGHSRKIDGRLFNIPIIISLK
ncbi:YhcN/YlaJ family sporulation lipoprotein, partial [Paenibacillus alginolyticus]|uniref:YhcN/YlaJ family sporulation lipoprotein n=1 Tax=Paenibacillus alginolyticus TaxID=59839 RepID=UPI0005673949